MCNALHPCTCTVHIQSVYADVYTIPIYSEFVWGDVYAIPASLPLGCVWVSAGRSTHCLPLPSPSSCASVPGEGVEAL